MSLALYLSRARSNAVFGGYAHAVNSCSSLRRPLHQDDPLVVQVALVGIVHQAAKVSIDHDATVQVAPLLVRVRREICRRVDAGNDGTLEL